MSRIVGHKRQSGISQVEVLGGLGILALAAAFAAYMYFGQAQSAKDPVVVADVGNIKSALDIFFLDTGRYPTDEEGLRVLVTDGGTIRNWQGPYMRMGEMPKDPWGNPYRYKLVSGAPHIYSLGADNAEGGTGDAADFSL